MAARPIISDSDTNASRGGAPQAQPTQGTKRTAAEAGKLQLLDVYLVDSNV
jgi:hypothetical protein